MTADANDPINALLAAHGLRRTTMGRRVLGWFLAHPDTSFTHAQLLDALSADPDVAVDKVTLYRLVDRLTQVGLLLCRVDANRVRRYQSMPASVLALPHFECQSCHQDKPLSEALHDQQEALERASQMAVEALRSLGYRDLHVDVAVRGLCVDCAEK
ncbi:Fur family transcriptional regulator [Curvibacter sp. CHRR-16]|uniref:Fur family transcriptional regulator n=1 Tax=Curvibacter sp. CHRR-16 TaxID=2835872 RepID=UPI001BDA10A5|nr:Fur family transcriptional regulator [Curvibacter sp. CHRR-16]MBT0571341.1 Fur family transcriptional regulator [Curvibacter sp. CHRR-16]